jgi:hypothetical protein
MASFFMKIETKMNTSPKSILTDTFEIQRVELAYPKKHKKRLTKRTKKSKLKY